MKKLETQKTKIGTSLFALFIIIFAILGSMLGYLFKNDTMSASAETTLPVSALHRETKIYSPKYSADYYSGCEDYSDYIYSTPSITVLTHGLSGNASHWSNSGGGFAYNSSSLIAKIGNKLHDDYDLYVAKGGNDSNLELYQLNHAHYSIDSVTTLTDHITSADSHIIVIYESGVNNLSNSAVYNEFDRFLDTISMQYKDLTGRLPIYNLVGHSRGGLTNVEFAFNHPYNVATLISMGTPYSGSTLSSIDPIMDLLNYKKDEYGQWENEGVRSILDMDESIRLRDGWNSMKAAYEDTPVKAIAVGTATSLDFVQEFVSDLRNYQYVDGQDKIIDILEEVLQIVERYPGLSNMVLEIANGLATILKWFDYDVYSDLTSGNVTFEEAQEILGLVEMINGEIVIMDDLFIDLNSQLANGYKFPDKIGYTDFDGRLKTFTAEDFGGGRAVPSAPAVVHNLECMNDELTSFIAETFEYGSGDEQIENLTDLSSGTIKNASGSTYSFVSEHTGSRTFSLPQATIYVYELVNGLWDLKAEGYGMVNCGYAQGKEYILIVKSDGTGNKNYQFKPADSLYQNVNSVILDGYELHIYSFVAPSDNFYSFSCSGSDSTSLQLLDCQSNFVYLNEGEEAYVVLQNKSSQQSSCTIKVVPSRNVNVSQNFTITFESNIVKFSNSFDKKCEYQIEMNAGTIECFDAEGQEIDNSCTIASNKKIYYFTLDPNEECYVVYEDISDATASIITPSIRQFRWLIDDEILAGQDVTFRCNELHRVEFVFEIDGEIVKSNTRLSFDGGLNYTYDNGDIMITTEPNTDATLYVTPEASWNYGLEIHLEPKYQITFVSDGKVISSQMKYVGEDIVLPTLSKKRYNGVWRLDGTYLQYNFNTTYTLSKEEDIMFTAIWTGYKYSIEYSNLTSPIGSRAVCPSPTQYEYGRGLVLTEPYFTGNYPTQKSTVWRFVGWYTSDSYTSKVTAISKDTYGDKVFYAKWEWDACVISGYITGDGIIITDNGFHNNTDISYNLFFEDNTVEEVNKLGFTKATIKFTFTYQEKSDGYQQVQIVNSSGENLSGVKEYISEGGIETKSITVNADLNDLVGQEMIFVQFNARGWFNDDWYLKEYHLTITYF